jgi:3-oxoacyl-[acyl-carrier-protein] synthase III
VIFPKIVGTGSYVPERIITNEDMEKLVETTDEWITTRTGIKTRHRAKDDTPTSELAYYAAVKALEMAQVSPDEIELIIVGTATPDMFLPSTACMLQKRLQAMKAASFDLLAACTGFIYGLSIAEQYIKSGRVKTVLVAGAEVLSKITNFTDRTTCILFGDGAGAVVIRATEGNNGIVYTNIKSNGNLDQLIRIPSGGSAMPITHENLDKNLNKVHMKGNETFKHAVRLMGEITSDALEKNGLSVNDIKLFVPHQANIRIINSLASKMNLPPEKVWINIDKYGNTSSASVPIAFDEAARSGRLQDGDIVVMTAFGGGLTYGTVIYRW